MIRLGKYLEQIAKELCHYQRNTNTFHQRNTNLRGTILQLEWNRVYFWLQFLAYFMRTYI